MNLLFLPALHPATTFSITRDVRKRMRRKREREDVPKCRQENGTRNEGTGRKSLPKHSANMRAGKTGIENKGKHLYAIPEREKE